MKGFFAVFEGPDGSGKGTMVHEARKFLLSKGIPESRILTTAEPTRGYYGKKVREMLQSAVNPDVNAPQFLDLYVHDRREHIEKEIIPALEAGKIILCDRYKYSTFVYQGLQGIAKEKIAALHEGMPVPDLAFILDLPVEESLERIARRKKADTFERKDFMAKVREGFLRLKDSFPGEELVFINAGQDMRREISQICEKLSGALRAKGMI